MPEGPEIRRAADKVARVLVGNTVEHVAFGLPRLRRFEKRLSGSAVTAVDTRGKAMLTRFDNGLTIYSHNQLYGRWYTARRPRYPKTNRQLRIELCTSTHRALLYSASDIDVLTDAFVALHAPAPIDVDPAAREDIHELLVELRRDGLAVLLTTHDLGDIEQLCRRIIIIDKGQVLYNGLLEDLRGGPGHKLRLCLDLVERMTQRRKFAVQRTAGSAFTEKSLEFGLLVSADFAVDIGVDQVCEFLLYSHQVLPVSASLSCCRAV